ncbi:MAG: SUMF1/EgtB/PvdO family nonheme iron enzyme [Opitutaceae bacterium]|nr:SUMF1/EgtB/PvdO family nonheme iron enzyme [Opitutaceae bacterium]
MQNEPMPYESGFPDALTCRHATRAIAGATLTEAKSARGGGARRFATGIAIASLLWPTVSPGASTSDPAHYVKKATWQQTMIASLQALAKAELADGFAPVESETFRGGQTPQRVSVDVSRAQELFLFATGVPDAKWAVADWADAKLIGKGGKITPLATVKGLDALAGRIEEDMTLRSGLYQKMRLAGRQFDRGINVQADSVVHVPLNGAYERFEAWIGVDDWAGNNGSVRFSVAGSRTAARKRLLELAARDFPDGASRLQINWEREDRIFEFDWKSDDWGVLAARYAKACHRMPPLETSAIDLAASVNNEAEVARVRDLYYRSRQVALAVGEARGFDFEALRLALEDLERTFPQKYPARFRARLTEDEAALRAALAHLKPDNLPAFETVAKLQSRLEALKNEALLANPLLDFERLLVVKRKPLGDPRRSHGNAHGLGEFLGVPRQSSWNHGTMPNVDKWSNEIAVMSPRRPDGGLTTLYNPGRTGLVADIELSWDAGRLLFSMPDRNKNWQVCEIRADGTGFRQLTPSDHPDVHNFDPTLLPSGDIIFLSTAPLQGVPCNAGVIVAMMYKMDRDGRNIRQLTFEQDHNYTPAVMNDGRVLYLRWDYTDTPHVWNRLLMTMNPDGTRQMSFYGANSYWPNAFFYTRPIPDQPTKVVSVITGHHEGRVGELVVLDTARGLQETEGVVQRIPGRGKKVEPKIEDKLTEHSWPKYLHPWPLNDKYFIVACKPEPDSLWGIYLVDVFDNRVLLREEENFALLEPMPLRPRPLPPVIPEKLQPERKDALVYLQDIYSGPGLKDVPRGTVKNLRLFTYHFGYQKLAGIDHRVGADGPWEVKRVLGTVPVEADGSAFFHIPAKTPISLQPLDAEGKAIALMRSWMTAQPGENVSCVGCHEQGNVSPPTTRQALALERAPSEIKPWYGPVRGFSFAREVQPVLDKYCVGCHDGGKRPEHPTPLDLRRDQGAYVVYNKGNIDGRTIRGSSKEQLLGKYGGVFEPSYLALRQFIRVGGLESDLHLLPPKEFHADTSELIRILRKGHYNVQLDAEAWDRLITWIDLNAPSHGSWSEVTRIPGNQRERRVALRQLYGGLVEDCEEVPLPAPVAVQPVMPKPLPAAVRETARARNWPLPPAQARQVQLEVGPITRTVDLGGGVTIELVRIPAGQFVMGDPSGESDERPLAAVRIDRAFWMAKHEVTNEQYARFDPTHESRFEHRSSWIFSEEYLGWRLDGPRQPVIRVSWQKAMEFSRWLTRKIGEPVSLPTEAQWEYACRAGSGSPLHYGNLDADFSRFANLADVNMRRIADEGWRPKAPDLVPRDGRFDDGSLVTSEVGRYQPNAWGLHDMHGNAAEWTRTTYKPYPYQVADGRDRITPDGEKVVRGGSWRDRPKYSRSAYRWSYPSYQKVYNVGFRVVIEPRMERLAGGASR